jgi:hypothetical protein
MLNLLFTPLRVGGILLFMLYTQVVFCTNPCDNVTIAMINDKLMISNLDSPHIQIDVYKVASGGGWTSVFTCKDNCGEETAVKVELEQNYIVHIKFFSAQWNILCEKKINYSTSLLNAAKENPIQKKDVTMSPPSGEASSRKDLTSCASGFFRSLQNLVAGEGTKKCGISPNISEGVFGQMTDGCYNVSDNPTGRVSYTLFKLKTANKNYAALDLRAVKVIWGAGKSVYDHFGVCTPPNMVYELPIQTQNHDFEAILIPVEWYQSTRDVANQSYDQLKKSAFPIGQVTNIQSISMEVTTGYIAMKEKSNYDDIYSSKGIVVHAVFAGNNKVIDCYLINNYDALGTIQWKRE